MSTKNLTISTNLVECHPWNSERYAKHVIIAGHKGFPDSPIRILIPGTANHCLQDEIAHQLLADLEAQTLGLTGSLGPRGHVTANAVLDDGEVIAQSDGY